MTNEIRVLRSFLSTINWMWHIVRHTHICFFRQNWKVVEVRWNVMAHVQKPDFVFRRKGRVHLNRRGRQFSWLLAAEVCASAVVMLDTPCSEVVWRVLATHSIRQFPLHFLSRTSQCAITFQLESTTPSQTRLANPIRNDSVWRGNLFP